MRTLLVVALVLAMSAPAWANHDHGKHSFKDECASKRFDGEVGTYRYERAPGAEYCYAPAPFQSSATSDAGNYIVVEYSYYLKHQKGKTTEHYSDPKVVYCYDFAEGTSPPVDDPSCAYSGNILAP